MATHSSGWLTSVSLSYILKVKLPARHARQLEQFKMIHSECYRQLVWPQPPPMEMMLQLHASWQQQQKQAMAEVSVSRKPVEVVKETSEVGHRFGESAPVPEAFSVFKFRLGN